MSLLSRVNMKKIIILAVLAYGSFQIWDRYSHPAIPIFDEPYIAVYGRNSCSFTKKMLKELESEGVNYHYFIVDDDSVSSDLWPRMESSGISTRRYNLPVVDVNGNISVRPSFKEVLSEYRS